MMSAPAPQAFPLHELNFAITGSGLTVLQSRQWNVNEVLLVMPYVKATSSPPKPAYPTEPKLVSEAKPAVPATAAAQPSRPAASR